MIALTLSDPLRDHCPKVISIITLWFVFCLQKKDRGDLQYETRRKSPRPSIWKHLLRTYQQLTGEVAAKSHHHQKH
jgi:hypothetical protein